MSDTSVLGKAHIFFHPSRNALWYVKKTCNFYTSTLFVCLFSVMFSLPITLIVIRCCLLWKSDSLPNLANTDQYLFICQMYILRYADPAFIISISHPFFLLLATCMLQYFLISFELIFIFRFLFHSLFLVGFFIL